MVSFWAPDDEVAAYLEARMGAYTRTEWICHYCFFVLIWAGIGVGLYVLISLFL